MPIQDVVVADDEFLNRQLLEEIFGRLGIKVRTAKDGVHALRCLEEATPDLVITDLRMPGMGGLRLLARVKERWPDLPVVMMTAYASVESAVTSMRDGAYDYLMKPFVVEHVEALLLRLNERQGLVRQVKALTEEVRDRHRGRRFLGQHRAMHEVMTLVQRAAASNATVLITGESGTGKELVARALHEGSPRAAGPFVKVNCAALTETLLASELFGHEKGAFTGADELRAGRFELAHGGTLLLDEISEIPPELQAKLLRVLEEREFERVGGSRPIQVDVRVVATTNRDLQAEAKAGTFREDLYYRLNVIRVHLPPLRERADDVPMLLTHYLEHFGRELGRVVRLAPEAAARLTAYRWPGNVRELVNVVERLVVLHGPGELTAHDLERCLPELAEMTAPAVPAPAPSPTTESQDPQTLAEVERRHILAVLDRCAGNKTRAARVLDLPLRTLHSRLAQWGAAEVGA